MWVCLLFALVISTNCWADPIAIGGTGTATLNYQNTSNPAGPAANTYQLQNLSHNADHGASGTEYYIVFGTDPFGSYAKTYNSVEWSVTIEPGTYEIAMTYASATWRVQPSFDIYDGSTLVHHIYSPSSSQPEISGWKWQTEFSHTEENVILSVEEAKTYTLRVTADGDANSGFCMGHISFTRTDAPCANPVDASFAKEGSETGSVPSTINSCEGSSITIPGQGSLVKTGYDFVGWSYNSTTYAPGASFTMPATNVNFTAVWEQHVVPAVTNLQGNVSNDDITLTWENYNKLELTTSNVAIEGFSDGNESTMSYTINNGVIECEYDIKGKYGYKSVEIRLPRERRHVTSIDMKYIFNDPNCATAGGIIPYMMYDGDEAGHSGNWTSYYSSTLSSGVSEFTDFNLVPTNILWGSGSGAYDDQWLIHKVGVSINPPIASTGTFSIKDIYINTYDGQTLLDEVIVVRKEGSAPTSMNDGTQVYSGLLNTYTDNNLPEGSYYYAVYVRDGDAYSNAVVTGPVVIAPPKTDANLVLNTNATTIPVGGLFTLTHTTADGYDGLISYSVTPDGVINFNESTGVITTLQTGTATITVTASETANFVGDTKTCTVTVTKNFVGDLTIEGTAGGITLNWFYNLPISLETEVTTIDHGGSYTSSNYGNGVRTIVYNCNGGTAFYASDFKTPNVENCKSFSVKLRGDEDNVNNLRIVPYSWVYRPNYDAGDLVADPIVIEDDWKEVVITPSYYYVPGNENIKGDAPLYIYSDFPVGCVAFFPMSTNAVNNKQLQLKEAYFQLINTNGLTSSVALVRKKGSAPANASDGEVVYSSSSTTYNDVATLDAGATYYYRVFAIYNDYTYMSNAVSIDVPAPPALTTYTRTGLTAGDYGTICLPYAVAAENIAGADIYEFNGWQTGSNVVELDLVDAMEAGHPYIYQATASEATWRYLEQNYTAAGSHKGLIGSYTKEEITPNDGNYIIYANQLYLVDCTQIYVGVNKAYINRPNAENAYEATSLAPGKKRVYMGVYGEQVITDINQITNDQSPLNNKIIKDNQLFILRDGKIYNAQGQLVK